MGLSGASRAAGVNVLSSCCSPLPEEVPLLLLFSLPPGCRVSRGSSDPYLLLQFNELAAKFADIKFIFIEFDCPRACSYMSDLLVLVSRAILHRYVYSLIDVLPICSFLGTESLSPPPPLH